MFKKGYTPWNKGKTNWRTGGNNPMYGRKASPKSRAVLLEHVIGEKNVNWKGNEVGYGSLHAWVKRHLGKPDTCSNCGVKGLRGHKIHWANKSRQYKREVGDWIRLGAKCHGEYDKGHRLRHTAFKEKRTTL